MAELAIHIAIAFAFIKVAEILGFDENAQFYRAELEALEPKNSINSQA